MSEHIRVEQHSAVGGVWLIGWLFTIGFLQVTFWHGVSALFIWPYYLGVALRSSLFPFLTYKIGKMMFSHRKVLDIRI